MIDLTINNVIEIFSRLQQSTNGDLLKSFRYGNLSEINVKAKDIFPLLFLEYPFNIQYEWKRGGWWKAISFSFMVLDRHSEQDNRLRDQGDPSTRSIIGKSEMTAEQILSRLHKSLDRCNLDVTSGGASGFTMTEQYTDVLTGVQVGMTINGPSPVDNCEPIFDINVDLCDKTEHTSNCYY